MIGIQIISIFFALLALYFSYTNFRRGEFSRNEMGFWSLLWIGFIGIALFPGFVSPYVQKLGFARLMDFAVVVGFVVFFGVLFHNYLVVKRLQKRLERLVQDLALDKLEE